MLTTHHWNSVIAIELRGRAHVFSCAWTKPLTLTLSQRERGKKVY
jgi:hypothetical protein